eukprot:GDKI01022600.1.p1 GENE.GDKI01022600.1~~GDKI01022600.1.p1  ORF type:complete len:215 (-),score=9.55 GDKI01022600.1:35-679(-)
MESLISRVSSRLVGQIHAPTSLSLLRSVPAVSATPCAVTLQTRGYDAPMHLIPMKKGDAVENKRAAQRYNRMVLGHYAEKKKDALERKEKEKNYKPSTVPKDDSHLQKTGEFGEPLLKSALYKFKAEVDEKIDHVTRYEGWPPRSRTDIGKLTRFKRHLFVFNRRLRSGRKREPTLCINVGRVPVLMFSKHEFESFMSKLPWIKNELATFKKKL